jgi:hypothetical protein
MIIVVVVVVVVTGIKFSVPNVGDDVLVGSSIATFTFASHIGLPLCVDKRCDKTYDLDPVGKVWLTTRTLLIVRLRDKGKKNLSNTNKSLWCHDFQKFS